MTFGADEAGVPHGASTVRTFVMPVRTTGVRSDAEIAVGISTTTIVVSDSIRSQRGFTGTASSFAVTSLPIKETGRVLSSTAFFCFLYLPVSVNIVGMSTEDFYCEEVLSGKTPVVKAFETDNVLAYHHTRPFWGTHIVVIPKKHVDSLLTVEKELLGELLEVVKTIAAQVMGETGAARVLTNLGDYQDSKHLHFHVSSGEQIRENKKVKN